MVKGWSFNKVHAVDTHGIPLRQKMVCLRKPFLKGHLQKEMTIDEMYFSYEPEVLDLTKVEIKVDLLVCTVRTSVCVCEIFKPSLKKCCFVGLSFCHTYETESLSKSCLL